LSARPPSWETVCLALLYRYKGMKIENIVTHNITENEEKKPSFFMILPIVVGPVCFVTQNSGLNN
jgi:hypothetical protein